jgi:putative tricarboxylic transport membrane protein
LGSIAEQGFVQTYLIGNASGRLTEMFFMRPISIGIICAALLTLHFPIWSDWKSKRRTQLAQAGEQFADDGTEIATEPKRRDVPGMIFAGLFVVLGIAIYIGASALSPLGAVFPIAIAAALIVFSVLLIAMNLRRPAGGVGETFDMHGGAKRRIALGIVMLAWVLLMPEIGFLATSLAAFVAIMVIADYDRPSPKTWAIWIASGALICIGFWWLMANVLLLRMPVGALF